MADFLSSILFIFDYLLILNFVLLVLTYSIFRNIIGQNKIRFIFDFYIRDFIIRTCLILGNRRMGWLCIYSKFRPRFNCWVYR